MRHTMILATLMPLSLAMPNLFQQPLDHDIATNQACLRACFPKEPSCPSNMDPKQVGNCWTCCLRPQEPSCHESQSQSSLEILRAAPCHLKHGHQCCKYDGCARCCTNRCKADVPFGNWGTCRDAFE